MYRSAHRWVSRSMLTDLFDPRWWLTAGGTVKSRVAAPKPEDRTELASAPVQVMEKDKHDLHADKTDGGAALSDRAPEESDNVAGDVEGQFDERLQLRDRDPLGVARAVSHTSRATSSRAVGAPGFAGAPASGLASSLRGAHFAGGSMSTDPLAPFLRQGGASGGRGSGTASGGSGDSGHVVILDAAPSGQTTAHVTGPQFLAFGMPFSVCGCGYYTSPTRILDLGKDSGILQPDGQLPGTRLVEGPDHVSTGKAVMGASVSDPLLDRNLSFATTWTGTANWNSATAQNGILPGGGAGGNGGTKGTGARCDTWMPLSII